LAKFYHHSLHEFTEPSSFYNPQHTKSVCPNPHLTAPAHFGMGSAISKSPPATTNSIDHFHPWTTLKISGTNDFAKPIPKLKGAVGCRFREGWICGLRVVERRRVGEFVKKERDGLWRGKLRVRGRFKENQKFWEGEVLHDVVW